MELVRAAALKGYFEVADELKLDPLPLLRRSGLTRSMVEHIEQMLPARSVIRLLEESAEAASCATFGLQMAERRELADLGMVSLLIAHQQTLGDALAVLAEYRNRINSNLALRVEKFGDMALLREAFSLDPPMPSRQVDDLAMAVLYGVCRSVVGPAWQPISVSFRYDTPLPADRAVYQRLFSCPIEFGSEFDGILIKSTDLLLPNPRSEPALALHARRLVEAMVNPGERSMVEEVEEAILMLMPAGRASISAVADSLGLNIRTLQRRLTEEGMTFGEMLDRIRVREVNRYFAHGRQRLTDVAHLLGYASLGAFSRWYSQKFNETPSQGRKRIRGQSGKHR
jgi:AraC-like DNA-binding protein